MNAIKTADDTSKIDWADIVLIEQMKMQKGFEEFQADVDLNLSNELKLQFIKDEKTWLPRLIAQRAAIFCERRLGVLRKTVHKQVNDWWLIFVLAALGLCLLIAVLWAAGVPSRLFGFDEKSANVGALGLFVLMLPLPVILSVAACFLLTIKPSPISQNSQYGFLLKFFRMISAPGLLRGIVWLLDRAGCKVPVSDQSLKNLTVSRPQVVTSTFVFASNFFTLLVTLLIWLILWGYLDFNEVNYRWGTSRLNLQDRIDRVAWFGYPVSWMTKPPSAEAIQWTANPSLISQNINEADYRKQWSQFLLSATFVYGVLPRLLIIAWSAALMYWHRKTLLPSNDDEFVQAIVRHIFSPPVTTANETLLPADDFTTASVAPKQPKPTSALPVLPEVQFQPLSSVSSNESAESLPKTWAVVGYELETKQHLERYLAEARVQAFTTHQQLVDGAREQAQFLEAIARHETPLNVLVIASSLGIPDYSFETFLTSVAGVVAKGRGATKLIVSDGKALLERFSGARNQYDERMIQWKQKANKAGLEMCDFHEFDLSTDQMLRDAVALLDTDCLVVNSSRTQVRIANKFSAALDEIKRRFAQTRLQNHVDDGNHWKFIATELLTWIDELYAAEKTMFHRLVVEQGYLQRAKEVAGRIELPKGVDVSQLAKAISLDEILKRLNLSPGWMIAGAIGGVGIAAAIPLVAGAATIPLTMGAAPYLAGLGAISTQWIRTKFSSGLDQSQEKLNASENETDAYLSFELELAVRSCLLRVVLLEFQGNDSNILAEQVARHLRPIESIPISTRTDVEVVASTLRQALTLTVKENA